ncbi:recombination protein RecR [Siculibacillus lacustris]|uniref:Recombination protein RecR n=1 Tax=Siculibacillus lacustris TaxID=1549641 RepID=A0A4Q9VL81_9HYPH|nr:recombination mediator RecR [Siculibacillus lacustris]TBW35972.1 recombination protein RecR [Siculibacillus lacustris]
MARHVAGPEIERLIQFLGKLPGLGPRSARRAALHLIKKKETLLGPLTRAMAGAYDTVGVCTVCGNVDTIEPCTLCRDTSRDGSVLVVVEDVGDLWALERAAALDARYHVLGGVLSPLDGIGPSDLAIASLLERCRAGTVREVVLAVNATVEGQTTAHYITDQLAHLAEAEGVAITVTRLAHGVPVGGELDYLDDGTLAQAMRARTRI